MKPIKTFRYLAIMATALSVISCSDDNNSSTEPTVCPPAYITGTRINVTVLDYSPAPGQFINEIPEYVSGDTYDTMNSKATECLNNGDMISLGSFGGSVTIKTATPIKNISGCADFRILGNAVYATSSVSGVRYGSAEPGIVLVMQDTNGNGLADDTWYELKGDQTGKGIDNYTVTYYFPEADASDAEYIHWDASNGDTGYINRVSSYHTQSFFPLWLDNTSMTFSGRRLPDNGKYNSSTGKYDLTCYTGYADSHPNTNDDSNLDISNAIDSSGNSVSLTSIDFIKIYTGVLQANGPLGECSTEIAGIEILY